MDMRPEPNNEIDLLLRQLSRQNGISVSQTDEQHLDADEMNSYVANALPPKTRARYMQHLVDCSSCRKMVAQLSAAEGPVAAPQPSTVVEPSGLKSFLASLFSPLVLRYAVPALGVILIAVVGLVMFQQQQQERGADSVAQVTNAEPNKSAPESSSESTTPTTTQAPAERNQGPRAGVMADAPPAPKPAPAEEAEQQPKVESKTGPPADQSAATTDTVQPITTDGTRADQANKNEPAKKEADTKEKQRADDEVVASAPSIATVPGNKAPEPQQAKAGERTGAGTGGVAAAPQSRQELRRARKDESTATFSNAETRTVAGREFVKRGNVWFDLGYNSSQSITNITRGTEQYRDLVADEPAIHTIAENLKSEFVVVWKGRTYRVR